MIVDDLPDKNEFSKRLWSELEILMKDENRRQQMAKAAKMIAHQQAALKIAQELISETTDKPNQHQ